MMAINTSSAILEDMIMASQRARSARWITRRSWLPCEFMKDTDLADSKVVRIVGLMIHVATARTTEWFWKRELK